MRVLDYIQRSGKRLTCMLVLLVFPFVFGCNLFLDQAFDQKSASQTLVAGNIQGQFDVNSNGAATYEIDLEIPKGVNQFEPSLSLSYNSQRGNGLVGQGWSLAGLSSITRCSQTIAQDGIKGGVNFDVNDRFCVDGKRLVAINHGIDGEDGTEYRLEREEWSRYYSKGKCGSGPCYFTATSKAGTTVEYGKTDDARILAQGKDAVRVWAVNRTTDKMVITSQQNIIMIQIQVSTIPLS